MKKLLVLLSVILLASCTKRIRDNGIVREVSYIGNGYYSMILTYKINEDEKVKDEVEVLTTSLYQVGDTLTFKKQ